MKKEFSSKWIGSKQPRKQRKYVANAPLNKKRKLLSVNLNKELRKKHGTRNGVVRKKDKVKIMRGKFKGKTGKVTEVKIKLLKIYVEGIQKTKLDGSKVNVPLRASNLQIIELYLEDKKRMKKKVEISKKEDKELKKKEIETKSTPKENKK